MCPQTLETILTVPRNESLLTLLYYYCLIIVFLKISPKDDYDSQTCYFEKKITFFFRMDIITYM